MGGIVGCSSGKLVMECTVEASRPAAAEAGASDGGMVVGRAVRLSEVAAAWAQAGIDASLGEGRSRIGLGKIAVPKALRGAGMGSRAMAMLCEYADFSGQTLVLTPALDFGASSLSRLQRFYGRFGFLRNAAGSKDFTISESMYRVPKQTHRQSLVPGYPMEPHGGWYVDEDYLARGGRLVGVSPSQYLAEVRPLHLDEESIENIDLLKERMQLGLGLGPLALYADGNEDGRHRAHAARELGVELLPVIAFGGRLLDALDWEDAIASEHHDRPRSR